MIARVIYNKISPLLKSEDSFSCFGLNKLDLGCFLHVYVLIYVFFQ